MRPDSQPVDPAGRQDPGDDRGESRDTSPWRLLPKVRIQRPSTHGRQKRAFSRLARVAWGVAAGLPWGVAALLSPSYSPGTALLIALVGFGFIYFGVGLVTSASGILAANIHFPSGSPRPPGAGYSRAEAMAARGLHEEAAHVYRTAAESNPDDPGPCLRLARLHRDGSGDHETAAYWFREARRRAGTDRGLERQISRELIELYRRQMGEPSRAMSELARFAELHPGDPWAERARTELRRLKEESVEPEA